MHGKGTYRWPDGRLYDGSYVNDKKEGYGEYRYPDGRCYKGMWQNSKQHGEGIFIDPNGNQKKGEWVNGKRTHWLDEIQSEYTQRSGTSSAVKQYNQLKQHGADATYNLQLKQHKMPSEVD